jgi:hypothetical protein
VVWWFFLFFLFCFFFFPFPLKCCPPGSRHWRVAGQPRRTSHPLCIARGDLFLEGPPSLRRSWLSGCPHRGPPVAPYRPVAPPPAPRNLKKSAYPGVGRRRWAPARQAQVQGTLTWERQCAGRCGTCVGFREVPALLSGQERTTRTQRLAFAPTAARSGV